VRKHRLDRLAFAPIFYRALRSILESGGRVTEVFADHNRRNSGTSSSLWEIVHCLAY
jgi:hypothetical protein